MQSRWSWTDNVSLLVRLYGFLFNEKLAWMQWLGFFVLTGNIFMDKLDWTGSKKNVRRSFENSCGFSIFLCIWYNIHLFLYQHFWKQLQLQIVIEWKVIVVISFLSSLSHFWPLLNVVSCPLLIIAPIS